MGGVKIKRWGCSPGKYLLKFDSEEHAIYWKGKWKHTQKGHQIL
jgi:uncharacterized cupin superfamily protein